MHGHIIRVLTFAGFALATLGSLWLLGQYDLPGWYDLVAVFGLMVVWKAVDDRLGVGWERGE